MARMPRLVVPSYPHHVTQRGNRRMNTFFSPDDEGIFGRSAIIRSLWMRGIYLQQSGTQN
jgi:REP element-mobilizing transposase RayT